MGFVMKADGAAGFAYANFNYVGQTEVWITYRLGLTADALALFTDPSSGNAANFMFLRGWGKNYYVQDPDNDFWAGGASSSGTTPAPVVGWQLVEIHHHSGVVQEMFVDGTPVWSNALGGVTATIGINLGLYINTIPDPPAESLYFDDVKIGTTRGGTDIFEDDFEDGTLDAWTAITGAMSVVADPFDIFTGRVYVDANWRIIVTSITSQTLTLLDHRAHDASFLFPLNAPAYHSAQVAADDPEINIPWPDATDPANLTNNRRLIFAFRREAGSAPPYIVRFGGIVQTIEDQGTDIPVSRYTAYDPWQYLMSRPVRNIYTGALPGPDGLTFPAGTIASDIALGLLETTEAVDGDTHIDLTDLSLVEDTEPLPADITFDAGLSVGEAWNQLVETGTIDIALPPIYEPSSKPGKVCMFQCSPMLGQVRFNQVMTWDRTLHNIVNLSRLVDGTRLANRVQWFDGNGNAIPLQSDAASIAANGEYWAQQFFPDARNETLLELSALAQLLIRRNGERTVSIDAAPEAPELPLRDYKPGDWLPIWASRNLREPLGIDYDAFLLDPTEPGAAGYMRIEAIPVALDDNGVATTSGLMLTKDGAGSGS